MALLEAVTDSCQHKHCDIPHFPDRAANPRRDLTFCEETPNEVLPILPGPVAVVTALPRFKKHMFQEAGHGFDLPKSLALSSVAIRVLHTRYDHVSPLWVQFQGLPRQEASASQELAVHPKYTGQELGEKEKGREEPSVPAAVETSSDERKVGKKNSSKYTLRYSC